MANVTHVKTKVGGDTKNTLSEDIQVPDVAIEGSREYTRRGYNLRYRSVPANSQRYDLQIFQKDVSNIHNEEEARQILKPDMSKVFYEGALKIVVKNIVGVVMTQMTETSGIKKHWKDAVAVMYNEFFQLDDKTVFEGVMVTYLTQKQKKMALREINLIKETRCGKLKGRTIADGSAQRGLYTKE